MALIMLDQNAEVPYIPRFDRRNSENPLTVYIKYMPASLHDEYLRKLGREQREASVEIDRINISKSHDKNMFMSQITKVENFVDVEGNQVTSVEKFYNCIDIELRNELIAAMASQSSLTAGQRKN